MSYDFVVAECCAKPTRLERFRRKFRELIKVFKTSWHTLFWGVLHVTELARPYSKFMCNRGWYVRFSDGRCQWCGEKHG